ncbi:MAG: glutamine amidotransferase [Pseudomonadota bacterium]
MKVTIVETGLPPEQLQADWPSYPTMFEALLGQADPELAFETISPATGDAFPDPASLDAILITGSASGVYDPEPWMQPLFDFIRAAAAARTPQFGVCFGHQAMAEALGGVAEKSSKGWAIGRSTYASPNRPSWMTEAPPRFSLAASHQDQVTTAPPETTVIATSDFCEFAGLAYNAVPAASLQPHPEFSAEFSSALHETRRDRIGDALVNEAIKSFDQPLDSAAVGLAMGKFFRTHARS